jgi:hypothetical protein
VDRRLNMSDVSDGVHCYRAALLGVAYSCERGGSDNTLTARGKEQDAMARTVLVSFLGKGIRATEEQPRSHLGYRTARYDFTHLGGSFEESAMFGLALLRHLRAQNQKPNVWLILGSPQSSWDALIEAVDIEALDSQQMETLNALFQRVGEAVKRGGDSSLLERQRFPNRNASSGVGTHAHDAPAPDTSTLLPDWLEL